MTYWCLATGAAMAEEAVEPSVAARPNAGTASGKAPAAKSRPRRAAQTSPAPQAPQIAAQDAGAADGFAAYDWDGDGNITREEWARGPKKGGVPAAVAAATGGTEGAAAVEPGTPDYTSQERAAELAESNPKQLGEVTVTAQRRKESAQRVPTSITVLGGRRLIDQNIGRSASEVLNYVPNASAGTQFHGRPRWWIRGVGTGQQQLDLTNPVGFYQDQVYMSNSTSTGFPLFDLERVEVLRGPQGTLWGKNTTGGAIDVVSRKPSLSQTQEGYLKLIYGTYNNYIAEGAYGARLNDYIAVRGAFHYDHQDGRFDTWDPVSNNLTGQRQGGFDDAMFRVSVLGKITPDLEALFNVHYRNYYTQGGVGTLNLTAAAANPKGVLYKDPLTGYTNTPNPDINVISSARRTVITDDKVNQKGALLNLTQKFGGYSLVGITGYEDWSSTNTGSAPSPQSSWQVSQEVRLLSPREDRWNWITGLHYFYENIDSTTYSSTLPCGVGFTTNQLRNGALPNGGGCLSSLGTQGYSRNQFNHENESVAVFASTTFNFTEKFLTTVGVRYTHETKDVDQNRVQARAPANGTLNYNNRAGTGNNLGNGALTTNPLFYDANNWWSTVNPGYLPAQVTLSPATVDKNGTATNFRGSKSVAWDLVTYDLTPQFKINNTDMVYFKHARGAKSGGFNTGASQLRVLDTIIQPEILYSYEVGAKTGWFDGRLKANAALFYYDYEGDQLNITAVPNTGSGVANSTTGYIYNIGQAHSQGAEFEIEALPLPDLHIIGNIGLLDTRFDDVGNINQKGVPYQNQILVGNEMVRAPHFTSFLQADYRVPYEFPLNTHLVASGDWRFTSPQYYYVNFQDRSTPVNHGVSQGDFSLVNFRLTLASNDEKYSLTGYINNALDTAYLNHSGTPSPSNLNGGTQTWGQPRTFGLQLNARLF
ncbi:Ferric-pseudobactin 358 receptor [Myxococcaceae bacterium]|nr:Ferric-pseudobactin 358 receptor [Myxococcaceae bacterium]